MNISWTAVFFPKPLRYYNVYHTNKENRTIFSISSSGVLFYDGNSIVTKYIYLTRPFNSTNIMFEIRDITLDDAGHNGGISSEAAWSGGGVVLIVKGKLSSCSA